MNARFGFLILILTFMIISLVLLGINHNNNEKIINIQNRKKFSNNNNNFVSHLNEKELAAHKHALTAHGRSFRSCPQHWTNGSLISPQALDQLKSVVNVILHDSPEFDRVSFHWVTPLNGPKLPFGVVVPTDEQQLIAALSIFRENCIHPVMRAGGHSFSRDYQEQDGWTVHVGNLTKMQFNREEETVTVGAGVEWRDIYKLLDDETKGEYSIVGGECVTVGVSGFTLGGGYGSSSRLYGLASDNVVEMKIVTADMKLLTVNAHHHSDLFWALRGAGNGNFGVVTEFTFKVHKTGEVVYGSFDFKFNRTLSVPQQTFTAASKLMLDAPPDFHLYAFIMGKYCTLKFVYMERRVPRRALLVDKLLSAFEAATHEFTHHRESGSYADYMRFESQYMDRNERIGMKGYFQGHLFDAMPPSLINMIIGNRNPLLSSVAFFFEPAGGAINAINVDETAFPHRTATFSMNYAVWWSPRRNNSDEVISAARAFGEQFRAHEAYVGHYSNYPDEYLEQWPRHYYASNLERLLAIKRKYDPDTFWRGRFGLSSVTDKHLKFKLKKMK